MKTITKKDIGLIISGTYTSADYLNAETVKLAIEYGFAADDWGKNHGGDMSKKVAEIYVSIEESKARGE